MTIQSMQRLLLLGMGVLAGYVIGRFNWLVQASDWLDGVAR